MLKLLDDLLLLRVRQVNLLAIFVSLGCDSSFRQVLQVLGLLVGEVTRKGVKDLIELVNIVDRVEENEHLSLLIRVDFAI